MASPASKKRNTAPMDGNAAYDLHSTAAEEYRYSAPVEMPHAPRTTEAVVPESVPTPKQAIAPLAVLGFRTAAEVLLADAFEALGISVTVVTEDGTMGARGFVTDALPEGGTYVYACGPMPMLQALCSATPLDGQLSLEARMGCGFGACMGCTCETTHGSKRVCKDGPVFTKEEIVWPQQP